jgi:hypothetical protein
VLGRPLVPEARITLLMAPPTLLTVGRARPDGSVPQTRQTPQRRSKFAQPATTASKELKLPLSVPQATSALKEQTFPFRAPTATMVQPLAFTLRRAVGRAVPGTTARSLISH